MRGGAPPHHTAAGRAPAWLGAAAAVPVSALSAVAVLAIAVAALLVTALHSSTRDAAPASRAPSPPRFAAVSALHVRFTPSGAHLQAGAMRVSLRLVSVGEAGTAEALPAVAPVSAAAATEYLRPGIAEWYVDKPRGLEQGFSIERPPRATPADGRVELSVEVAGNGRLSMPHPGSSVVLSGPAGVRLRYGQLHATDANGRSLPSRLSLRDGAIVIRVGAAGARYPLRIDPFVQLQPMIRPEGEESVAGALGTTVAVSGDGDTAIAGATRNDGAAFVFARAQRGAAWVRQGQKLVGLRENHRVTEHLCEEEAGEPAGCGFGASIALSADGNTALIGSPLEEAPCEGGIECAQQGAAWVFTRSGDVWTEQQRIVVASAEEFAAGRFGRAVALSADGNTALIGAPGDNAHAGAAWVFTRSAGHWSKHGPKLVAPGEVGAGHFGFALALSAAGTSALIGAPADESNVGSAWSFGLSGETWAPAGRLVAGQAESGEGHFGFSVALSAGGELALVGGPANGVNRGGAWSFARGGAGWGGPEQLTPLNELAKGEFGYTVALAGDAGTALVGGPGDHLSNGAAWAFTRAGGAWAGFSQKLIAPAVEGEAKAAFGTGLGLSADGAGALVGGPAELDGNGALWAFERNSESGEGGVGESPPPEVKGVTPKEGPASGGTVVTVGGSNLAETTAVSFGGALATLVKSSNRALTVIAPAHPPGVVDVTVTANGNTSEANAHDRFTYTGGEGHQPPPTPEPSPEALGPIVAPTLSVLPFAQHAAPAARCAASVPAKSIAVNSKSRAAVKLVLAGAGTCRGRVTLAIKKAVAHHRPRLATIASTSFSQPAGRTLSLSLALNKLGRTLLHARHGKLTASLTVLKLYPAPVAARTASVRLSVPHKSSAKH